MRTRRASGVAASRVGLNGRGPRRPVPAGRSTSASSSRAICSTAVAMAATSRPTENTSMSWPSCRTSTISRSERTQRTREPAIRRCAASAAARPGSSRRKRAHGLLDAHEAEAGRAQAGGHPQADEVGEGIPARGAVAFGAGERRAQESAAVPVVELARGEAGEAGGARGREPGFEDVTLEFHACVLHPRDQRRPLEHGDRCDGRTVAGA